MTDHCPVSLSNYDKIMLAHGGGGELSYNLLHQLIIKKFDFMEGFAQGDSVLLEIPHHRLAFTTDSYVVHPLFFSGGDIGKLAVIGTVNDLAVSGACPKYLSCSLIIEEGFSLSHLEKILDSMAKTARECQVKIVAGDTKVVNKGQGDGVYINTTGIGVVEKNEVLNGGQIEQGDLIIVSGDIGRHGIAIMASRQDMDFEGLPPSDCESLYPLLQSLKGHGLRLHCARDLTRGGLSSALVEFARDYAWHFHLDEEAIPLHPAVQGACELLGLDPLTLACEGRLVFFCAPDAWQNLCNNLITLHPGLQVIGSVKEKNHAGVVTAKTAVGTTRQLRMFTGEQLPRIC